MNALLILLIISVCECQLTTKREAASGSGMGDSALYEELKVLKEQIKSLEQNNERLNVEVSQIRHQLTVMTNDETVLYACDFGGTSGTDRCDFRVISSMTELPGNSFEDNYFYWDNGGTTDGYLYLYGHVNVTDDIIVGLVGDPLVTGYNGPICVCAETFTTQEFDISFSTSDTNAVSVSIHNPEYIVLRICREIKGFTDGEALKIVAESTDTPSVKRILRIHDITITAGTATEC